MLNVERVAVTQFAMADLIAVSGPERLTDEARRMLGPLNRHAPVSAIAAIHCPQCTAELPPGVPAESCPSCLTERGPDEAPGSGAKDTASGPQMGTA